MNRATRRTLLAFLLITFALAVPCGTWFHVAIREAALEAAQAEKSPRQFAELTAEPLADRVAARLEALREAESRRPVHHYQGAQEAGAGAPPSLSPLAQGSTDPLVRAHFQIDAAGRLTVPTSDEAARRALGDELQPSAPDCLALLREHRATPDQMRTGSQGAAGQVRAGPFRWFTAEVGGQPRLVALREAQTPRGELAQGFVIEPAEINELLRRSRLPAQFLPGTPARATEAAVAIKPAAWRVAVLPDKDIAAARADAAYRREEFLGLFLKVVLIAVFVDLGVVALVWQSETLAQQRSQFAASAAHELRTPLAGLRMYAEMLAEGLGDPARARDYARRIAGEVERLARVVANVLGFSRLERGRLRVQPEPGDLGEAVRACGARLQPTLEAAGARVEMAVADGLPQARFDRDALSEILQNLLDNAEKYTRVSGDRAIRVTLAPAGDGVALSVADHGPGLPPEVRRHLFRPFTRGSSRDAPPGLGLGLAMVHTLARAQAATVRYDDAPGGGAVFTVTFPAAAV